MRLPRFCPAVVTRNTRLTHQDHALPVPKGMAMAEAAALCETFFTVWTNVFMRGGLKAGERFLVHGGSSGIGTTAIQLARHFGARVFATAGSAEKCAACEALGAERAINYREADFVEILRAEGGANLILDMVGGPYLPRNVKALDDDGRLVQIAFLQGPKVELNFAQVMMRRLTITGSTLRPQSDAAKADIADALRTDVWPLLECGTDLARDGPGLCAGRRRRRPCADGELGPYRQDCPIGSLGSFRPPVTPLLCMADISLSCGARAGSATRAVAIHLRYPGSHDMKDVDTTKMSADDWDELKFSAPRSSGIRPRGRARDLASRVHGRRAGLRVRRGGHGNVLPEGLHRHGAGRLALPLRGDPDRDRQHGARAGRATPGRCSSAGATR